MSDAFNGEVYEETKAAEIDAIVTGIVQPLLDPAGFTLASRRKWVRARPPIRQLFQVYATKGASFAPCWAISLDFVPHPKGGGLGWHRTDKSSLGDLIYYPVDFEPDAQDDWSIFSLRGPEGVRRDVERVLPAAVRGALAWFEGVDDIPSARRRAEELARAERPAGRSGINNYVQHRLAYAFLLARTGAEDEARAELDRWIAFLPEERETLRSKLRELLGK